LILDDSCGDKNRQAIQKEKPLTAPKHPVNIPINIGANSANGKPNGIRSQSEGWKSFRLEVFPIFVVAMEINVGIYAIKKPMSVQVHQRIILT